MLGKFIFCSAAVLIALSSVAQAQFTAADADTLMTSFKANFYHDDGGGKGHYTGPYASGTSAGPGFWQQAEEIEATEDAAQRNAAFVPLVSSLLNGFLASHTSNWTGQTKYNDDMMWATIAFVRGYNITGTKNFLTVAKSNFDAAWARGYDSSDGGMWWTTDDTAKLSCVESPTSVAAYLLGDALNDSSYKQKSTSILQFEIANFYDSSTGTVWDGPNHVATTYNQGVFIRAAGLNKFISQATMTMDHMMNVMGSTTETSNGYRILNNYGSDGNNAGFNSIAIRWAALYMKNNNLQSKYLLWLQANAQAAWDVRDSTQNLSWDDWHDAMPTGQVVGSWQCVSSLAALQDVPAP